MTDPRNAQNGSTSKIIGAPSEEMLELLDPEEKIDYLKDHVQKLLVEKQNFENKVLKEVSKAPADQKKDTLISELKTDIEKNKSLNDNFEVKLTKALDKVEDQLSIKKDKKSYTLYDRILRLGSSGFSILESLKLQITDCLTSDINNYDYIQDILYKLLMSLGEPDEAYENDTELDNLETKIVEVQQIAFGLNYTDLQLRKTLQTSVGIQQDLYSLLKLLKARVFKLKQQISFLKEHRGTVNNKDMDQDNAIGDYSGGSFVSTSYPQSSGGGGGGAPSYRSFNIEKNKMYYKPHNSVETNRGEEIDPHALSISIRAEVEHEFTEKTFQMQQELNEAQTKAIIVEKEKTVLNSKFEKMKTEFEGLSGKYKKLLALNKENQTKAEENEKKVAIAKKQIAKLTGKPVTDIIDEDQEKLKKVSANFVELKKRYEKLKEDSNKLTEELDSNKQKLLQLESDKKKLNDEMQAQITELKEKCSNSTKENEKLKKYVEAYKKNNVQSKSSIESLKAQLSKASNDHAQQMKDSNEKFESQLTSNKQSEEKLKSQNKKLLDSLNGLRKELGLDEVQDDLLSDGINDDFNDEAMNKVHQIIDHSNNSANQLDLIRKSLGIADNEANDSANQNSLFEQIQSKIDTVKNENQKLKENKKLMRKQLGLQEEEEEENENNEKKPKTTVASELQRLKEENENMKNSLNQIYNQFSGNEDGNKNMSANDLSEFIKSNISELKNSQEHLNELIGNTSDEQGDDEQGKSSMSEEVQRIKSLKARINEINSTEKLIPESELKDKHEIGIVDKLYDEFKTQGNFVKEIKAILSPNETTSDEMKEGGTQLSELRKKLETLNEDKTKYEKQLNIIREELHLPVNENGEEEYNEETLKESIQNLKKNHEEMKTREQEILNSLGLDSNDDQNIIKEHQNKINENDKMKRTLASLYEKTSNSLAKTNGKQCEAPEEVSKSVDSLCEKLEENVNDIINQDERLVEEQNTLLTKLGLPTKRGINGNDEDGKMESHSSVEEIIEQHQKLLAEGENMKTNLSNLRNILKLDNNKDNNNDSENNEISQEEIEQEIKKIIEENDTLQEQVQNIRNKLENVQNPDSSKSTEEAKTKDHLNLSEIKENGEIIEKQIQKISEEFTKAKNSCEQLEREMKDLKTAFNIDDSNEESKETSLQSKLANTLHENDQNKSLLAEIRNKIGLSEETNEEALINKINEHEELFKRVLEINSNEKLIDENENQKDSQFGIKIVDKLYEQFKEQKIFVNHVSDIVSSEGENDEKKPKTTVASELQRLKEENEIMKNSLGQIYDQFNGNKANGKDKANMSAAELSEFIKSNVSELNELMGNTKDGQGNEGQSKSSMSEEVQRIKSLKARINEINSTEKLIPESELKDKHEIGIVDKLYDEFKTQGNFVKEIKSILSPNETTSDEMKEGGTQLSELRKKLETLNEDKNKYEKQLNIIREELHLPTNENGEEEYNEETLKESIHNLKKNHEEMKTREQEILNSLGLDSNDDQNIIKEHQNKINENDKMKRILASLYSKIAARGKSGEEIPESVDSLCEKLEQNVNDILNQNDKLTEEQNKLLTKLGLPTNQDITTKDKGLLSNEEGKMESHSSVEEIIEQHQKLLAEGENMKTNLSNLRNILKLDNNKDNKNDNENNEISQEEIEQEIKKIIEENDTLQEQVQNIRSQLEEIKTNEFEIEHSIKDSKPKRSSSNEFSEPEVSSSKPREHLNLSEIKNNGEIIEKHIQTLGEEYSKAKDEREQLKREMKELKSTFNIDDNDDNNNVDDNKEGLKGNDSESASTSEQIISRHKDTKEENKLMKKTLEEILNKIQPSKASEKAPLTTAALCEDVNESISKLLQNAEKFNECQQILGVESDKENDIKQTLSNLQKRNDEMNSLSSRVDDIVDTFHLSSADEKKSQKDKENIPFDVTNRNLDSISNELSNGQQSKEKLKDFKSKLSKTIGMDDQQLEEEEEGQQFDKILSNCKAQSSTLNSLSKMLHSDPENILKDVDKLINEKSNLQSEKANEIENLNNVIKEQNEQISDLKSKIIEKESKLNGILEERSAYQDLLHEMKDSLDNPKLGQQIDSPLFQKLLSLSDELSSQNKNNDKLSFLLDERSRSIAFLESEGFIDPTSSPEERDKINVPNQVKQLIEKYKELKAESENHQKEKQDVFNLLKEANKDENTLDDSINNSGNPNIVQAFKKLKENEKTLELQSSQLNKEIVQLKDSLDQIKNSVGLTNLDEDFNEDEVNKMIQEISNKAKIASKLDGIIDSNEAEIKPQKSGKSNALEMLEKLEQFNKRYEQMTKENEEFKDELLRIKEILGLPKDEEIPLNEITAKIEENSQLKKELNKIFPGQNEEENGEDVHQLLNHIKALQNNELPIDIAKSLNKSQMNEIQGLINQGENDNVDMADKLKEIIYQEAQFEDQLNKIIETLNDSKEDKKKNAKEMLNENNLDEISENVKKINDNYHSLKTHIKEALGIDPTTEDDSNLIQQIDTLKSNQMNSNDKKEFVLNKKYKLKEGSEEFNSLSTGLLDQIHNIFDSLSKFSKQDPNQNEDELIELDDQSLVSINDKVNEIYQNYTKLKEENEQLLDDKMKSEGEQTNLLQQILGDDAIPDENIQNKDMNEFLKEKVKALQESQKEISQYQQTISNLQNEKLENEQQIDQLNQKLNRLLDRLDNSSQSNIRLQESDFTCSLDFFENTQENIFNMNESVIENKNQNVFDSQSSEQKEPEINKEKTSQDQKKASNSDGNEEINNKTVKQDEKENSQNNNEQEITEKKVDKMNEVQKADSNNQKDIKSEKLVDDENENAEFVVIEGHIDEESGEIKLSTNEEQANDDAENNSDDEAQKDNWEVQIVADLEMNEIEEEEEENQDYEENIRQNDNKKEIQDNKQAKLQNEKDEAINNNDEIQKNTLNDEASNIQNPEGKDMKVDTGNEIEAKEANITKSKENEDVNPNQKDKHLNENETLKQKEDKLSNESNNLSENETLKQKENKLSNESNNLNENETLKQKENKLSNENNNLNENEENPLNNDKESLKEKEGKHSNDNENLKENDEKLSNDNNKEKLNDKEEKPLNENGDKKSIKVSDENDQFQNKSFKEKIDDLQQRCLQLEEHVNKLKTKNRRLNKEKGQLCTILGIDINDENNVQKDPSKKSLVVANVKALKQSHQQQNDENEKLNDLVNEQKSKLKDFENNNKEISQQLEEAKKSINSLMHEKESIAEILGIDNSSDSIVSSIQSMKQNMDEVQGMFQEKSSDLDDQKDGVFSVSGALNKLKQQLNDLNKSNTEKDETIKTLKKQNEKNQSKLSDLNEENQKLKDELEEANQENETKISNLTKENKKLKEKQKQQNDQNERKLSELIEENEKLKEQNETNESNLSDLTEENKKLKLQNKQSESKLSNLTKENKKLKEEQEEQENQKEQTENKITKLNKENQRLKELNKINENKVLELTDENQKLEEQNESNEDKVTELSKENKKLKEQNESNADKVTELSKENKKLKEQNESNADKVTELSKENKKLKEQNESNEDKVTELSKENKKLKEQNESNEDELVKLNQAQKEIQTILGPSNDKTPLSTQLLNYIQKNMDDEHKQNEELESKLQELQMKYEENEKEKEKIKSEAKAAIEILQKKEEEEPELSITNVDIIHSNSPLLTETQSAISFIKEQRDKINEMKAQIEKLNQERNSIMNALYGQYPDQISQNGSGLVDQLETLGKQINRQSDILNNSFNDEEDNKSGPSSPSKSPSSSSSRARLSPRSSGALADAMGQIRKQLNEALEESLSKDVKIEELKQKIDDLEKVDEINDDYSNESKEALIEKLQRMKNRLNKVQKENKKLRGENVDDENDEKMDDDVDLDEKELKQEHRLITKILDNNDNEVPEEQVSQFNLVSRVKELRENNKINSEQVEKLKDVFKSLSNLFGEVDEDETDDFSHLSVRVQEIHAINSALQSEITKLKEKLDKVKKENDEIKKLLNIKSDSLTDEDRQMLTELSKENEYQIKNRDLQNEKIAIEEEEEENENMEMSQIIDLLHLEGNMRMEDIKDTITQLQKYETELREIQAILDQNNDENQNNEEVSTRVKQLVQTNHDLREKIESLLTKLSDFTKRKDEKQRYNRQIRHIEDEMKEKDDSINQIQQLLNISKRGSDRRSSLQKKQVNDQISSLEKENQLLKQKISELQKELEKLGNEQKAISSLFNDNDGDSNNIQEKIEKLKENLRKEQEKCQNLEKTIKKITQNQNYSDDYDYDNGTDKKSRNKKNKARSVDELESQIKYLDDQMKKKNEELERIKQSLLPFSEDNSEDILSNLNRLTEEGNQMKKDRKVFEKERKDIGKLFNIQSPPPPVLKNSNNDSENQKSFPLMIKEKVNELIKEAKKYEAKKFESKNPDNLLQEIEEKNQIIMKLKEELQNTQSSNQNKAKNDNTILKKIEQAKKDVKEIGSNTQTGSSYKSIINRLTITLNEIESFVKYNNTESLCDSSSNTEYDELVSSIAQTICPDEVKVSESTQTKIGAIISNLELKIQQQKDQISILQPSSSNTSKNKPNNDDARAQKQKTVNTLENILNGMESVKKADPSNGSQILDAINKLKLISQQIDKNAYNLKDVFKFDQIKLFTEEQYKEFLLKVENQINNMLKTLAETANLNPPGEIHIFKEKNFDLELDGDTFIINVHKIFVKICATIKKQFQIASAQQTHFTKKEAELQRQIHQFEEYCNKCKEKRHNDKDEIEKLTEANKKLKKRLSKIQDNQKESIDFLFSLQPSISNRVTKESSFIEIIRIFAYEYGKQICTQNGSKFVKKLVMIKKKQDNLNNAFAHLIKRVEDLEGHYLRAVQGQQPSNRYVQKKSKK